MMKICIFADIHGNGPAFRAACQKIIDERAGINIFLGDLCGYYYDQMTILPMLSRIPNLIAIKGNHDLMYLNICRGDSDLQERYLGRYGRAMENLLAEDRGSLVTWLSSLPDSYKDPEGRFCCFHGSPEDPLDGYVYPDSPLGMFETLPDSFFFLGHTHYRMHRLVGDKLVINPGSLGQPRDGLRPSYVVVELPAGRAEYREVAYDKNALAGRMDEVGDDNPYLREVLSRQP